MKGKITIPAGTPNDDNRDYLPEAIRGSDMVVNENGNNSQPYPSRLTEHKGKVLDDQEDTWYEYVPSSYDGTKKVPLVISMHGGMMTGWGQAIYTSWTLVAEREGFIVLFPNSGRRRFWIIECEKDKLKKATAPRPDGIYMNVPPENPDDNRDMNCVLKLIELMEEKYNIDEGRIFMQGMSMGNLMTGQFARYHGDVLAGAAGSGGPSSTTLLFDGDGKILNRAGPLTIWQTRLEYDKVPPHYDGDTDYVVKKNREYWRIINGCGKLPKIKIDGEDNFAFYEGDRADIVFRDIRNRDHGQTFDDAELVWDYLFSGTRRDETGKIVRGKPDFPREGDKYAIALANGKSKAYVNNKIVLMHGSVFMHKKLKYHGLNGGAIVRGEYFMVPVSFAASVFGAECNLSDDNCSAVLKFPDGRTLQFARGSIGCVACDRVRSMLCEAVLKNGELYIPIEWLCRFLFSNHISRYDGVLYITDHPAEISINMSHLLRDEVLN